MRDISEMFNSLSEKKVEKPQPIHNDFAIENMSFMQNREWDPKLYGGKPEVKVCFSFDDPKLLNDCPFVCKIFADKENGHKFFGVAYGMEINKNDLKDWGKKFINTRLLTIDGEVIENT